MARSQLAQGIKTMFICLDVITTFKNNNVLTSCVVYVRSIDKIVITFLLKKSFLYFNFEILDRISSLANILTN